ncbi:MAG TPA: ribosome maturation factor RimP [Arthrobacter sp.]|uniref:Ribosome maturation factor RimP n=1 Tax=Pseudarthrobacter niigatensis TaxID=369935 RepID=A0AAJ1SU25_9MICC|nr:MULTISPECIES: ribosome maturation factor RimP [Pseudarthrobacter]MDQ0146394.1 ribosome maturation factor RimP [Pseudarthrobacter niigatensis]MDQ0264944.1 ribosome maturation factor RimP [Pseudarthrobacter niigatensis]QDG87824.1 ribosome maturation factor RimP [Pseudarthrobacter sp. NIBRBAC000502770]HKU04395.1 ribosome maturation factor RimP [Arthrobacter sp.]
MSNAEATASPDHTGTGSGSAPAHNPEAARLRALLEPAVQANRLYLEDVAIIPGSHRVVHVVVDLPQEETGGVSLDVIADISKVLSDVLDNDPNDDGRPYDLEVSSPGVGRPLTEPRHWHRARGRMVKVNVIQGENVTGRIQAVDGGGVTLIPEVPVKKGMKPRQGEPVTLPFDRIRNGKVEIEFSHLPEDGLEPEHNGPSEEA